MKPKVRRECRALVLLLLPVIGCDNSGAREESRQKISTEQVVHFAEAINKRNAIAPALNPKVETHFELVRQILPDDAMLSVFHRPKVIKKRVLLEYHDTISVNGMVQTNCSYELDDCEVVIHLTLLPATDAQLTESMRTSWTSNNVIRSEKIGAKDVFISRSNAHVGGTVFGQKLLVSFFSRKHAGVPESNFAMSEPYLWEVLQSLAARVE